MSFVQLDIFARTLETQKNKLSSIVRKAPVAPMKAMFVPKLELQAVSLATRLKEAIIEALTMPINDALMWTESSIALQWLHLSSKQPVFVGNRVGEILHHRKQSRRHGTRGIAAEALKGSSLNQSPSFLRTRDWRFCPNAEARSSR